MPVLVVDRARRSASRSPGRPPSPPILCSCGGNAKRVHERLLDRHRLADELEAADRVAVLEQLLLVEREVVEVLPPLRLLLAAVVLEELREQPARLALLRAGEQLGRGRASRSSSRSFASSLALALLGRRAPRRSRPAAARAASGGARRASGSPPRCRRGSPRGATSLAASRASPRRRRPTRCRRATSAVALEAVELLDLLDRVARRARRAAPGAMTRKRSTSTSPRSRSSSSSSRVPCSPISRVSAVRS